MKEIYRKRGQVVRWENGTLVRVSESGVAIEDGELFTCEPERREPLVLTNERVHEAIRAIDLTIERWIVSHGIAEHEFGERTWSEETRRIHLSIVNGRIRALVDSFDDIERVSNALKRAEQQEREAPKHLVLNANVSAALLPSLPNVEQVAGGIDGKGRDIIEAQREPWPNWYRPSYRVRPIRMPLNLRLRHKETAIDPDLPRAVALLAPPDGLTVRVLIEERTRVYPSMVHVGKIEAVSENVIWYPYAGGSFGAEMML